MVTLHILILLTLAFLIFIVAPIALVLTIIDAIRHKASDRRSGGGGISNMVGAAMMEADRLLARPSIEHQIETENPVLEREADDGE
jgi:hypothetical protein